MGDTALVVMLFELIGLKIIFDVDLRDVGKTPHWDVDILSPHPREDWAVRGGIETQFTF